TVPARHALPGQPVEGTTQVLDGANLWVTDRKVTAPTFDFSVSGSYPANVSPLFALYYNSHSGNQSLGAPLTAAFPTDQGWIQFFESGALLLPAARWKHTPDAND